MTPLMWSLLAAQILAPLALLAWVAWGRPRNRLAHALAAAATASYLLAVGLAGIWLVPPWYTPLLYALALAGAMGVSRRRSRGLPLRPGGTRDWLTAVSWGAATLAFNAVALYALAGRAAPRNAVALAFPLADGTYYVASGGGNKLLNAHFLTLEGERYRPFRGQSHGVDLMKLGRWGLRARGIAPGDPAAYVIWNEPVHAPCAGVVIEAVDGRPDMRPPAADREYLPGNNVLLDCGGVWVLLAHFPERERQRPRGRHRDHGPGARARGEQREHRRTAPPHPCTGPGDGGRSAKRRAAAHRVRRSLSGPESARANAPPPLFRTASRGCGASAIATASAR